MDYSAFNQRYRAEIVKDCGTFYTNWISFSVSKYFTFLFYRVGISPNAITFLSSLCVVGAAAVVIATPDKRVSGLIVLLLLQLCYILDCVDGQVARLSGVSSPFGGFFDLVLDRFNNLLVFTSLSVASLLHIERSLEPAIFILLGLLGYCSFTITSMVRGFMFPETKGLTKQLDGMLGALGKLAHEIGDTGLHFLILSVGYMTGVVDYVALAYGIWGFTMMVLTLIIVKRRASDARLSH